METDEAFCSKPIKVEPIVDIIYDESIPEDATASNENSCVVKQETYNAENGEHSKFISDDCDVPIKPEVKTEPNCVWLPSHEGTEEVSDPVASSNPVFQCKVCQVTFRSACYLEKHLPTHTPKTYECPECGKTFYRKQYLADHMNTHSGIKPYKCEVCQKKFPNQTCLWKHSFTHIEIKPHICQVCRLQQVLSNSFLYLPSFKSLLYFSVDKPNAAVSSHVEQFIFCNHCSKGNN